MSTFSPRMNRLSAPCLAASSLSRKWTPKSASISRARTEDLIREGLTPREAACQGGWSSARWPRTKGGMRHSLGLQWADELWADLLYAVRILSESSGFTAIAVASLALAIGADTTIFFLCQPGALCAPGCSASMTASVSPKSACAAPPSAGSSSRSCSRPQTHARSGTD